MSYPIWSTRSVLEFAKKQQPKMPYEYSDCMYCALAQYAMATGVAHEYLVRAPFGSRDGQQKHAIENAAAGVYYNPSGHTWGEFAIRLEILLEEQEHAARREAKMFIEDLTKHAAEPKGLLRLRALSELEKEYEPF